MVNHLNGILKISSGLNYIFGAHIQTQFFYFTGLDNNKIAYILDNSTTKIGNKLYGTDLVVKNPKDLIDCNNIKIICRMGIYTDEIKKEIIKINDKVKFL